MVFGARFGGSALGSVCLRLVAAWVCLRTSGPQDLRDLSLRLGFIGWSCGVVVVVGVGGCCCVACKAVRGAVWCGAGAWWGA